MALPPGFLDELRSRTSIAQVAGRKVTWDSRKSNPGKGDYWAPCPFHQEKTASFHVDDTKGFYYCFGCHAKGDALGFVRETENMGFMDAVELLAREAGMQMPAQDPAAAAKAAQRAGLAEVMEMAVQFARLQLATAAAVPARDYLDRRGMREGTRKQFEIGFAPDSRNAMTQHLRDKDVPEADIVAAGLAIKPDDGGAAFDRFRGRIMFPIRDARGRAIAFGGRAMDPNAKAKYLNSPETPLFDKGRALYNIGPARQAAGKAQALIVAEGYMDVIALAQVGFDHAVAPLGTAVTQDQLHLMWRIAAEPVIALDGDTAGLRAAMRVIDNALPLLEAGKGLRFCMMPQGQDPDDLIRTQGAAAMQAALDKAVPMVALLWQRETEGHVFDSPERRAALDARLRTALNKITDPVIKSHYRDAIRDHRNQLFRPAPRQQNRAWVSPTKSRATPPAMPTPSLKNSLLAQTSGDEALAARVRESAILLGCLNHAAVAETVEAELEELSFLCKDLDSLRQQLLQVIAGNLHGLTMNTASESIPLPDRLTALAQSEAFAPLARIAQLRDNRHLAPDAPLDQALIAVREEIAKQRAADGMRAELRDAEAEMTGVADEGLTWRLQQATAAHQISLRGHVTGEDATSDTHQDLVDHLQKMIDAQIWLRKKK